MRVRLTLALAICVHLGPAPWVTASPDEVVISTPLTDLARVHKLLPDADYLGVNHKKGSAQLRLPTDQLKHLTNAGIPYTQTNAKFTIADDLERYTDPSEVGELLAGYARRHPQIAELREIGKSTDQRPIWSLTLTKRDGAAAAKPTVLFNAMHHAREVMSTEVALDIIAQLVDGYGSDPEVTQWLDSYRIVVVPQVNPDGNQRVHSGDVWWRKNTWKGLGGEVYGVDLNRNYPTLWNGCNGSSGFPFSDAYRGPSPASEPEAQAMMRLVSELKPVFNISYHSYSELIIFPFGCRSVTNTARQLFSSIAKSMAEAIIDDSGVNGTYRYGTAPELLYQADGSDLDYQWQEHNVMAYTIEINASEQGFQPNYAEWRDTTVANQRGGWQTLIRRLGSGGVRALAHTGQSYRIETVEDGVYKTWDRLSRQSRRPVRPGGLIYQALPPGDYRLLVYQGEEEVARNVFSVSATQTTVVDLGAL